MCKNCVLFLTAGSLQDEIRHRSYGKPVPFNTCAGACVCWDDAGTWLLSKYGCLFTERFDARRGGGKDGEEDGDGAGAYDYEAINRVTGAFSKVRRPRAAVAATRCVPPAERGQRDAGRRRLVGWSAGLCSGRISTGIVRGAAARARIPRPAAKTAAGVAPPERGCRERRGDGAATGNWAEAKAWSGALRGRTPGRLAPGTRAAFTAVQGSPPARCGTRPRG